MPSECAGGATCEELGSLLSGIPFWLLTSVQHTLELPRAEDLEKSKREPGEKFIVVMLLLLSVSSKAQFKFRLSSLSPRLVLLPSRKVASCHNCLDVSI